VSPQMNIILKTFKTKSVLSLHVKMVLDTFFSLTCSRENKYKVFACLFETLTNFKNCSPAGFSQSSIFSVNVNGRIQNNFRVPGCFWYDF
jgi:hypothetical protein